MTILDAFYSLGKKINKASGQDNDETDQGVVSEKFPELKLDMSNADLSGLAEKWKSNWEKSAVYADWISRGDENENYWLGKQFNRPKLDKSRPLVDNVIFESLETYLPQVTRRNPEPLVTLAKGEEQSPDNQKYATDLKQELGDIADEVKLRLKLKKTARHWSIYLLGAAKLGWDMDKDIPTVRIVRCRKLILDDKSTVDEDGYTGEFIGEHRKLPADKMLTILDSIGGEEGYNKIITDAVDGQMGTELGFIEWWTNGYMFWTMENNVLLKHKNPHWNYDQEVPVQVEEEQDPAMMEAEPQIDPATGEPIPQEPVEPQMETQPGFNHLPKPTMPFLLLSVFNLGKQPIDDTSLIGQNLASQDLVNKRNRQIDKNADSMNGGMVVSLERSGLTLQQANGVTEALRKGGTIAIPAGAVSEAIARMSAPDLPATIYTQLQDTRNRMRDVFGTRGSSPAGLESERTVRGKLQNRALDTDRIGGGFSEYLEQFADDIYNWFIQLLYVYDEKYAGKPHPKVKLTVKEGSLLPKDSASIAQQAIELAAAGKMATVDLYKRLEYPDAEEMAANAWLEANAPDVLFGKDPRVAQVLQARQQAAQEGEKKPPSTSISFKDLPPEGKAQLAEQAGLQLHPEAIAAHDDVSANRGGSTPAVPASQNEGQVIA